jgi:thioredoxin-related protein
MKQIVVGLLACWIVSQAGAAEEQWLTDLSKAQAKAKAESKMVLMDFTGSDWCPPCKALKKNVLSSPEFLNYAKKNLVLVEVDFPKSKPQTQELKKANQALQEKFNVEAYPTVIVLDRQGKQLSKKAGYGGEKPAEFVAKLEKLQKK